MDAKSKTHGGPRKGAGRKPQGARAKVKTSIAIDGDLLATVDRLAAERGTTRNAVIEAATRYGLLMVAAEPMTSDARRDDPPPGV